MKTKDPIKTLIVIHSYHHNNTLKIANAFAKILNATIKKANEVQAEDIRQYEMIGFGSGIDSGKHYLPLLKFAEGLNVENKKPGFIFSTSAVQGEKKVAKDHLTLRRILMAKGYVVLGEFSCKGFNTNSFLKVFGGMNKGKPDANDFKNAERFAESLISRI